jgi:hypothetical protein
LFPAGVIEKTGMDPCTLAIYIGSKNGLRRYKRSSLYPAVQNAKKMSFPQ